RRSPHLRLHELRRTIDGRGTRGSTCGVGLIHRLANRPAVSMRPGRVRSLGLLRLAERILLQDRRPSAGRNGGKTPVACSAPRRWRWRKRRSPTDPADTAPVRRRTRRVCSLGEGAPGRSRGWWAVAFKRGSSVSSWETPMSTRFLDLGATRVRALREGSSGRLRLYDLTWLRVGAGRCRQWFLLRGRLSCSGRNLVHPGCG